MSQVVNTTSDQSQGAVGIANQADLQVKRATIEAQATTESANQDTNRATRAGHGFRGAP
jgi:hypothetical protein